MKKVNYEIAKNILKAMPNEKKETLRKALNRNESLTSARTLENGEMYIYKEGWYLKLDGCRCSFSVFAKDNDGEFEIIRKPNKNRLHLIYKDSIWLQENDYKECIGK